jgi:hypothetical protein
MPSHGAGRQTHDAAPPFLHGVQEGLFPRFNDNMGRSDSPSPLSPRFVAFAGRYHRVRRGFAPIDRRRAIAGIGDLSVPGSRTGSSRWRRWGLPGSWGTLVIMARALRPRQDRSRCLGPTEARPTRSPHLSTAKTPSDLHFRGSITRPLIWLSTLRREGRPSPRKTRFWLPARLYQAGFVTRRVPTKGFRVRGSFSFPKLSWRKDNLLVPVAKRQESCG